MPDLLKDFLETYSFDDASVAWMKNKKKKGEGSYIYICGYIRENGCKCNNKPYRNYTKCRIHYKE